MSNFDSLVIPSPGEYAGFLAENSRFLEYRMFVDSWNKSTHYHNKKSIREGGKNE